jgi:hypothetical protein
LITALLVTAAHADPLSSTPPLPAAPSRAATTLAPAGPGTPTAAAAPGEKPAKVRSQTQILPLEFGRPIMLFLFHHALFHVTIPGPTAAAVPAGAGASTARTRGNSEAGSDALTWIPYQFGASMPILYCHS